MSYSPPGIETSIVIGDQQVVLPGGTRVLSLVGTSDMTRAIAGEQLFQPINRQFQTSESGVATVSRVYDYSGPGNSLYVYPSSGVGSFGSGYYVSGSNTIAWTVAANAYPLSTTPAIGSNFFVTYSGSYAGSGNAAVYTGEVVMQSGTYNDTLATSGISIIAVSGASGYVYPASGVSGFDSLGFSKDGSGYSLTPSGTLAWTPVTPSTYGYPSLTAAPISGTYYIDYSYGKNGDDFMPLNFAAYSDVVNQEGNEADWTLITSGPKAGTYQIARYNPLTVGAKVAFENQASVLTLLQISGVGNTSGAFLTALPLLEGKTVDVLVPLTVGSGVSTSEMSVSEKALTLQYTKLHCETMSNQFNKMERVSLGSLGQAEVGDATTDNTYIGVAKQLVSKRISLVCPGTATIQLQDPSGQFQAVDVDGCYLGVAVGALSCSSNNDPATPLTNQQLTGFTKISAKTSGHSNSDYLAVEKNNMAAAGCMVIDRTGSKIFVRQQLTTKVDNVIDGEFSVVTLIDYVSQSVRYTTNQFIGKKLISALVIPTVKGTILATMQALASAGIIGAIGTITVTIDPTNPTVLLSQVSYVPVFPLNKLKVTFIIKTSL